VSPSNALLHSLEEAQFWRRTVRPKQQRQGIHWKKHNSGEEPYGLSNSVKPFTGGRKCAKFKVEKFTLYDTSCNLKYHGGTMVHQMLVNEPWFTHHA